ncbi:MAG: hypothetical protein R8M45_03600 [Ghiorsea sp.]
MTVVKKAPVKKAVVKKAPEVKVVEVETPVTEVAETPAKEVTKKVVSTSEFDKWFDDVGASMLRQGQGLKGLVAQALNAGKSDKSYLEFVTTCDKELVTKSQSNPRDIMKAAFNA